MSELNYYDLYAKEYLKKTFYFCLKKTGNENEAEELSSDISFCIINELRRGVVPSSFSAWVWQIAKNRYARWVKNKRLAQDTLSVDDIDELNLSDGETVLDDYIKNSDISLLKRELAFIKSEYRDVIVAFYINDTKASEIAKQLNVPESTVRNKLFSRKKNFKGRYENGKRIRNKKL